MKCPLPIKSGFFIIIIFITSFSQIMFFQSFLYSQTNSSNYSSENNNFSFMGANHITKTSSFEKNSFDLTNGTWYNPDSILYSECDYFILRNVPFDSSNYKIHTEEIDSINLDIDLFVKFGATPTINDFDYKIETDKTNEIIEINTPEDDEYGDMHILVKCTYGSGLYKIYAHYIADSNGCFRNADELLTPIYAIRNITLEYQLGGSNLNDFFKIFLESGQKIEFNFTISPISTNVDFFIYNSNYELIASDSDSETINLVYFLTCFESEYYFLQFRNTKNVFHHYNGTIFDSNSDSNNRYINAKKLTNLNYFGNMDSSDVNDYYYFEANSGEQIEFNITITEVLSSPYYSVFIYDNENPINDFYFQEICSTKKIIFNFICREFNTSEISPYSGHKYYLRFWNTALANKKSDATSDYIIQLKKSWNNNDDCKLAALSYTTWDNTTTAKTGSFEVETDINDWYKISTKRDYTIYISINYTLFSPDILLEGYLIDKNGEILFVDNIKNITIYYTANYTGDYYFRLFKKSSSSSICYDQTFSYNWFIYTSLLDLNNNFQNAIFLDSNRTIFSKILQNDFDDYFLITIPSGFYINISGSSSTNLEIYLYNYNEIELMSDLTSPWFLQYQHTGFDEEKYYLRIYNQIGINPINYTFSFYLLNQDPDKDGSIINSLPIELTKNEENFGSNSVGENDTNDYFQFLVEAGQKIIINISGENGIIASLIKLDFFNREQIIKNDTIITSDIIFEYYSNSFYNLGYYYLRLCRPKADPISNYDWNITLVDFDIEDGSIDYATQLDSNQIFEVQNSLSTLDTNDWYKINVPSATTIKLEISTNENSNQEIGIFSFVINSYNEIYSNLSAKTIYYTNIQYYTEYLYLQIINENFEDITYFLTISLEYIDIDNNGALQKSDELLLELYSICSFSSEDMIDYYYLDVASGFNITVYFTFSSTNNLIMTCALWDESNNLLDLSSGYNGVVSFVNRYFNSKRVYIQFFDNIDFCSSVDYTNDYFYKANLTNNDNDGNFNTATLIKSEKGIIEGQLSANKTSADFNDLNDYYSLKLRKNDTLLLEIELIDLFNPFYSVSIYDKDYNLLLFENESNMYNFTFIAESKGTYFIRIFNSALKTGNYTLSFDITRHNFFFKIFLGLPSYAWFIFAGIFIATMVIISIFFFNKRKR